MSPRRSDARDALPPDVPADVVARVRAGDERAFEALFRAHYGALCAFAVRYVRERAVAEELVQDLFAELHARLNAAVDRLPERCRLVMQLRWRDGLSYAEIAAVMGISPKGVENQLSRGLKSLRNTLRDVLR